MGKSFIESIKEGYKQGIEAENAKRPEGEKLTPQKQRKNLIVLIIGIIGIFFLFKSIIGGGNPSECDCRKVMMYEEGAMQAGKRIVGDGYYDNTIPAAQRQCGLKYWEDIKKWQEKKGLTGTPADNAMEYFMEKCN